MLWKIGARIFFDLVFNLSLYYDSILCIIIFADCMIMRLRQTSAERMQGIMHAMHGAGVCMARAYAWRHGRMHGAGVCMAARAQAGRECHRSAVAEGCGSGTGAGWAGMRWHAAGKAWECVGMGALGLGLDLDARKRGKHEKSWYGFKRYSRPHYSRGG